MKHYAPFFTALVLLLALPGALFAQQWNATGALNTARVLHTSTLLANGKVLIVGGTSPAGATAELYDPVTGNWTATGNLNTPRHNHIALRLLSGKVLVAGGQGTDRKNLSSAELYDPATGVWTPTGTMNAARELPSATILPSGKVLLAGGEAADDTVGNTAELYDPSTGSWSLTGTMNAAREGHTATLLPNGKVLVVSGFGGTLTNPTLHSSTELYDSTTGNWTPTGSLDTARPFLKAVLLTNGKVLAVGGSNFTSTVYNTAELYDPATGQWSATGSMAVARQAHTLTLLSYGQVLVVGKTAGQNGAELYDPASGSWATTANLSSNFRQNHTATLLLNGKVLVAGGNGPLASAELYDSGGLVVATVSGASFQLQIAPKAIVSAFGQNFSTQTISAVNVLATTSMAGVTVKIKDVNGVERLSPLFFVSPQQINYQLPAGTAPGQAIVTVTASDGRLHNGLIQVDAAAPAIFTVNQQGTGAAAALDAITFAGAPFNATQPNGEPSYLAFFGTGLGADVTDADGDVKANVEARIDGQPVTVVYAGQAPFFVGLNQINMQLPVGISSGTHTFTLSRNGAVSNPVTVAIK